MPNRFEPKKNEKKRKEPKKNENNRKLIERVSIIR